MKKRILICINLILGSLSIALSGCGAQKKAAKQAEAEVEPQETAVEPVICMYGVRPAIPYDEVQAEPDSLQTPPTQKDTASQRPPRVVMKYGVPNSLR